jgi:uncharacterized membrane protein YcaP (DUF421 family)
MWKWLFHGWEEIVRVFVLAVLAYGGLVLLLRLSGKRTLSKFNVFDFVFVVALGSTLSMTILSAEISLAAGVVTLMTLIGLQIGLSWLTICSSRLERLVNGEPALLLHAGQFCRDTMKRERVTEEEILAAIRSKGITSVDAIDSVVLETDGSMSVVWQQVPGSNHPSEDVPGHPAQEDR